MFVLSVYEAEVIVFILVSLSLLELQTFGKQDLGHPFRVDGVGRRLCRNRVGEECVEVLHVAFRRPGEHGRDLHRDGVRFSFGETGTSENTQE